MSRKDEPDSPHGSTLSHFSINDTSPVAQKRIASSQLAPQIPASRGLRDKAPSRASFSPALLSNLLARATTTLDVQIMVLLSQPSDERSLSEFVVPVKLLVARRNALVRCFVDAPTDSVLREVFISAAEGATELAADMAAGGARRANQLWTFARELTSELTLRGDASAAMTKKYLAAQRQALQRAVEARPAPFDLVITRQICELGLDLTQKLGAAAGEREGSWLDLCLARLAARD